MTDGIGGISRGNLVAGGIGVGIGALATYVITKVLPDYQERNARRQGQIMAEEFAMKTGQIHPQGSTSGSSDLYSIKNAIEALNVRMDDVQKQIKEYKGG